MIHLLNWRDGNKRFVRLEFEEQNAARGLTASGNNFILGVFKMLSSRRFGFCFAVNFAGCKFCGAYFRFRVMESGTNSRSTKKPATKGS